jgi:hypothetical protein
MFEPFTESATKLAFRYDKAHEICTMVRVPSLSFMVIHRKLLLTALGNMIDVSHDSSRGSVCHMNGSDPSLICLLQVKPPPQADKSELVPKGEHVLTLLGTSHTQAIIAWIITA